MGPRTPSPRGDDLNGSQQWAAHAAPSSVVSRSLTLSQGETVEEALTHPQQATEPFLEEGPQRGLAPRLLITFEV